MKVLNFLEARQANHKHRVRVCGQTDWKPVGFFEDFENIETDHFDFKWEADDDHREVIELETEFVSHYLFNLHYAIGFPEGPHVEEFKKLRGRRWKCRFEEVKP